jgi:hypothetical protein
MEGDYCHSGSELAEEDEIEYDEGDGPKSKRWDECNTDPRIKQFFSLGGTPCFTEYQDDFEFSIFSGVIDPNRNSKDKMDLENKNFWRLGKDRLVEYQGYTGNEGASRTTLYHRFMLAIFPYEFDELDFLLMLKLEHGIKKALHLFKPTSEKCLRDLRKVVKRIGESRERYGLDKINDLYEEEINGLLKVLVEVKDLELTRTFIDAIIGMESGFGDIANNLAKVIVAYKWKNLKPNFYKHMCPSKANNFVDNCIIINVSVH